MVYFTHPYIGTSCLEHKSLTIENTLVKMLHQNFALTLHTRCQTWHEIWQNQTITSRLINARPCAKMAKSTVAVRTVDKCGTRCLMWNLSERTFMYRVINASLALKWPCAHFSAIWTVHNWSPWYFQIPLFLSRKQLNIHTIFMSLVLRYLKYYLHYNTDWW